MRRPRFFLLLGVAAVLSAAGAQAATVITGATLIDGTGSPPIRDAVIVVDERIIKAVGSRDRVTAPPDAKEIKASGKYVIPGLMDANVHLVLGSSIEFIVRYEDHYEDLIEEAAQVTLKNGVTTVFDSWGPLQPLINVRDRINRGETIGSRTFIAGNIVGLSGPFGRDFNAAAETTATRTLVRRINGLWEENTGPDLLWDTPDQVRREIRRYVSRGIDFLKYAASGHREENFLQFSPQAQQAIVDECHRAGIIAQTHTTSVESLRQALEAGVDMLQHGSVTGPTPIPDSTIELMLDKKVYCAVQPRTAKRLAIELEQADDAGPSRRAKERLQTWHDNEVRLIKAHVPLLLATDGGVMDPDATASMKPKLRTERPTELGEGHFLWFKAMVEKGMTPMDAIVSATRNIAAAYHKLDQLGTIQPGKVADLVVLDADPLADVSNIRKISLVMKDGQVVDRDSLPARRVLTAPRDTQVVVVTELGDIEIEVDAKRAPNTAANFLRYIDGRFFDGGSFFRTVTLDNQPNDKTRIEVIQAGVNPGREKEEFPAIKLERTKDTAVWHVDGAVSMARNDPDSARASFFICVGDQPELDFGGSRNPDGQGFAAFGRVVRGMEVVRRIQKAQAKAQQLTPPIRIVRVMRKPLSPQESP